MDKVAHYEEVIYKEASRAWKKVIGELSDDGIKKLTDSGILNHKKELAGLKRGTENIVARSGGIMDTSKRGKVIRKNLIEKYRESPALQSGAEYYQNPKKITEKIKNKLQEMAVSKQSKAMHRANNGFITAPAYGREDFQSVVSAGNALKKPSAGQRRLYKKMGIDDPFTALRDNIKKKDKSDKEWVNALFARHEADELRAAKRLVNQKGKHIQIEDLKVPQSNAFSHLTPEVLHRESANAAIAPKKVKDALTKVRSNTGETNYLRNVGDLEYGKSGVFNKRLSRQNEKTQIQANRGYI